MNNERFFERVWVIIMSTYHNYGDASFFYGGYVISEDSKDAYRIIACDATYDGYYHLMDARIPKDSLCINTDWMNSDVVADYVDFHGSRQSPEFAYACLQYYGPKKFGGGSLSHEKGGCYRVHE